MRPLLAVRDLHLRFELFEGSAHVLNGVSFEVHRGERVAIVGESGCGKSVTLKLIMGLVSGKNVGTSGSIQYEGRELLHARPAVWRELRGRQISPIYQDPMASLNPTFRIEDQMATVIRRSGERLKPAQIREKARAALARVAITDPDRVLDAYPFQLSGGLNQRVLISMALVNRPSLVLADEPGTALDVTVQEQTLRLMRELTEELHSAVLLITHNLGVVREFADRVYVMYAGNVVEEGPTDRIFADPKHPYTRALFDSVPKLTGGELPQGIDGHVPDYTQPPAGCRFHPRCPFASDACLELPALREVGPGHRAACVLYDEELVHV